MQCMCPPLSLLSCSLVGHTYHRLCQNFLFTAVSSQFLSTHQMSTDHGAYPIHLLTCLLFPLTSVSLPTQTPVASSLLFHLLMFLRGSLWAYNQCQAGYLSFCASVFGILLACTASILCDKSYCSLHPVITGKANSKSQRSFGKCWE